MQTVQITYLEMLSPAALKPKRSADPGFRVCEATVKEWKFNRFLYELVGSDWSWKDKQIWSARKWRDYAESAGLRTFVGYVNGSVAGYYELKVDEPRAVEIAIFGLAPKFIGRGYGGALLTDALEQAWALAPKRVWLHTCTLDHTAALANYQARGMSIYRVATASVPSPADGAAAL